MQYEGPPLPDDEEEEQAAATAAAPAAGEGARVCVYSNCVVGWGG